MTLQYRAHAAPVVASPTTAAHRLTYDASQRPITDPGGRATLSEVLPDRGGARPRSSATSDSFKTGWRSAR
jgi:hypothetical protein